MKQQKISFRAQTKATVMPDIKLAKKKGFQIDCNCKLHANATALTEIRRLAILANLLDTNHAY